MILTFDAETKDPAIDLGLGGGWCYDKIGFKVLGFAYKIDDGKEEYTVDFDLIRHLVNRADLLVAHNAAYDLGCLLSLGIEHRDKAVLDTEIMGRIYYSALRSYSLDALSEKYLGARKDNKALEDAIVEHRLMPMTKVFQNSVGDEYVRDVP